MSLVKLRPGLEREVALQLWLGEHADVVRAMPQVRKYVIALAEGSRTRDQWDAIATLKFESREELETALADPRNQRDLTRTREPFLERVDAFVVEEHVVIDRGGTEA